MHKMKSDIKTGGLSLRQEVILFTVIRKRQYRN